MSRTHDATLAVAVSTVANAAGAWPELAADERAAAFAAAIDAVEAVESAPIERQHHLLAAKRALVDGTAEGLSGSDRRAALLTARGQLDRIGMADR
ncbi:hypothetical protein [Halolamina sp. C58]|uniref:hypothetical protein n=1 Tax=Halolamina sp. C58 TaxID=3421640 RepID=UPI003EBD6694